MLPLLRSSGDAEASGHLCKPVWNRNCAWGFWASTAPLRSSRPCLRRHQGRRSGAIVCAAAGAPRRVVVPALLEEALVEMRGCPITGGCNFGAVRYEVTGTSRCRELLPLQALPAAPRRRPNAHANVGRLTLAITKGAREAEVDKVAAVEQDQPVRPLVDLTRLLLETCGNSDRQCPPCWFGTNASASPVPWPARRHTAAFVPKRQPAEPGSGESRLLRSAIPVAGWR
jgi:hypothetical protein